MSAPKTKSELLTRNEQERAALVALVDALPAASRGEPGALGEWSVKDTIAHLAAWERLFLGWYEGGVHGLEVSVPAEGYTWRQMDELNEDIYRAWRDAPWEEVLARWQETSGAMCDVIEGVPEDELFAPAKYAWTGKTSIAGYAWPCAGEHYRWARTEIEKGLPSKAEATAAI